MTQTSVSVKTGQLLLLKVPRTNEKKELAAEQMFASLYGLLLHDRKHLLARAAREHLSFEIAALNKHIGFYIWVPEYLKSYVEEQIYAQYPTAQISEVPDYFSATPHPVEHASEIVYQADDVLPIKTFPSFEVDPLAGITASLAKLEEHEGLVIQILVRPADEQWHRRVQRYVQGSGGVGIAGVAKLLMGTDSQAPKAAPLAPIQQARIKAAEEKGQKLAYEVKIRIMYQGNAADAHHARMRLQAITSSFKQFNLANLNGFTAKTVNLTAKTREMFLARTFGARGITCNIEELASLYHLPHTNVETPFILWASSQTAEPPANLPVVESTGYDPANVSPIGVTNFRGHNTSFGLLRGDRNRHLYIIGQTGTGKSGLLELLTISDIHSPYGFAVIDPHGDYAINILRRIPENRTQDVIYFNPADTDYPIAFNPLEVDDAMLRTHIVSELIGVLKRMFESWGPRLEYILRYTLLALVEYPDATMLDITRMLTDKKFRQDVLSHVTDPVVTNFWNVEFASWNDKFAAEAVAPVLNKVGAFTANPIVRNIIGQPKSSFNIRRIMDERKILIVNLSRGLIGEDNASLLGALLVTKIQMAAMSRADIEQKDRLPFSLYVDEFQNFATDSFATILSEARKYGLSLTVANQYIAQMSLAVRDAVFGNVGSIIAFRMGADDARVMERYYEPKFTQHDLVHMHNRNFVISLTIEGEKVQSFSGISLELPALGAEHSETIAAIVAHSRKNFSVHKSNIEDYVQERYVPKTYVKPESRPPARPAAQPAPAPPSAPTQPAATPATATPHAPSSVVSAILSGEGLVKPKRKRTRRRKKSPGENHTTQTSPQQSAALPDEDDTVLHLR